MSITDPLTLTFGANAHPMIRVNQDNFGSTWIRKDTNLEVKMYIRHNDQGQGAVKSERHIIDVSITDFTPDIPHTMQMYCHMIIPKGSDPTAAAEFVAGVASAASTQRVKLLNGEN